MKNIRRNAAVLTLTAACALSAGALVPISEASAEKTLLGYFGDVNHDMSVNADDLTLLESHILNREILSMDCAYNADINQDGSIDSFDLTLLRKCVTGDMELIGIYSEDETTEPTTEPTTEAPTDTPSEDFITAPIAELDAGLPSQGNANLVIFYVDFPDCQYSYAPTADATTEIAFGEEDPSDPNYPFDSMHAFYSRSSKGAMNLQGQAFRYTTKENRSYYDTNKLGLLKECYEAFDSTVDFSQFDGDVDGKIDASLLTVPTAAGNDDWWPCAGDSGGGSYTVDGKQLGHLITGNAQIESDTNYSNFISSYLHEMGHCMGLPDYYLYWGTDSEGMHGAAGIELMDTDASTDFGALSKLMLGWYREDQISVYNTSMGTQTYTLSNAQTDNGNCVIIPLNNTLDSSYFSEFFIIEYASLDRNNSGVPWWQSQGSGIRIYHAKADVERGWFNYFKYQNGSEYNNSGDGIRFIKLVNDGDGDNYLHSGDVVTNSTPGFGWYDSSGNQTIDPGVTINIGDLANDTYTITISNK